MSKGATRLDKAIHEFFENIGNVKGFRHPCGEFGRYLTYYAEEKLYVVFDMFYYGFFFVEADSPNDAIEKVNSGELAYLPKECEELDAIKDNLIKQEMEELKDHEVSI